MKKKGETKKSCASHQQEQEKSQQHGEFLETVLESLVHPLYVIDVNDYTIKMANSAAMLDQAAGTTTCYALTHRADKPCHSQEHPCPLEMIKKTNKPVTVEHIHYDKDGNARNVEIHGFPIFDSEGNLVQMIEYCLDITKRKQAEEILSREKEKAQSYLDIAGVIMVVIGADERVELINRKGCDVLGYGEKEILGKNWFDTFIPEKDREATRAVFLELIAGELEPAEYYENLVLTKTGDEKIIAWHNSILKDANGHVTATLSSGEDITSRRQAEDALARSEERYSLAQQAANIGSWDWNILTGELTWSEQIEPMFGFRKDKFGRTYEAFLNCVHPEDRQFVIDSVNTCLEQDKDYNIEHRIVWANGMVRWISEKGDVTRDDNGKAVRMLGIVQDITERKEVEKRQILAEKILKRLNQKSTILEMAQDIIKLIKQLTGLAAVGIRRRQGDDFPYLAVDGFAHDFVESENYLCARNKNGDVIYDSQGKPLLECMCGGVITGCADPALPFFTEGGSFWTNTTTELLAKVTPETQQTSLRNSCNEAGYESVALIPLRSADEIVGLLQLNDTQCDRFSPEVIHFFEGICASIGVALARVVAEDRIENLAKFPSENPNPVLRIRKNGVLLYANDASVSILAEWNCTIGKIIPENWCQIVSDVFSSGSAKGIEIDHSGRTLVFMVVPVTGGEYVNLYGRDITERKQAENALQTAHDRLEQKVQERTKELANTIEILQNEIAERKRLEREVLEISEEEQRRIGMELHDGLQQELVGMTFDCQLLKRKLTFKALPEAEEAARIHKLVNDAIDHTRDITRMLYPIDLESKELTLALAQLAARVEHLFHISCPFKCNKAIAVENHEMAINIYRIAQEAITNAIKHGKADRVTINLNSNKNRITLTVKDNGVGLAADHAETEGMGLRIMKYRSSVLGASLSIRANTNGAGTLVSCSFENKDNKQ